MEYLDLDKISSYTKSYKLSNEVWEVVLGWDHFAKNTIGQQLVNSMDSISANISEGFGRYTKKDKIRFYRISQGSLKETIGWVNKSKDRKLMSEKQHAEIMNELLTLPKEINQLVKFTNEKLKF